MARPDMPRLSQETLALLGVGVALAALTLTSIAGVRGEVRAFREELRVEIRAVRDEGRTERQAIRDEIQAARDEARTERQTIRAEARADREAFQNQILRLTEQQGVLSARLHGLRDPPAMNP